MCGIVVYECYINLLFVILSTTRPLLAAHGRQPANHERQRPSTYLQLLHSAEFCRCRDELGSFRPHWDANGSISSALKAPRNPPASRGCFALPHFPVAIPCLGLPAVLWNGEFWGGGGNTSPRPVADTPAIWAAAAHHGHPMQQRRHWLDIALGFY